MPHHPTDAELCAAARAGDRGAAGVLVRRHAGLVASVVRSLGRVPSGVDHDDLFQVGRMGLYKAALNWSPDRGAKFSTYAYNLVRNEVRDELTASARLPVPETDLTDGVASTDSDTPGLAGVPQPAARPASDVEAVLSLLTTQERELVVRLYGLYHLDDMPDRWGPKVRLMDAAVAMAIPYGEALTLRKSAEGKMREGGRAR